MFHTSLSSIVCSTFYEDVDIFRMNVTTEGTLSIVNGLFQILLNVAHTIQHVI